MHSQQFLDFQPNGYHSQYPNLEDQFSRLTADLVLVRRAVPERVKHLHIDLLARKRNGLCPCCEYEPVLGEGVVLGEWDHWFGRNFNDLDQVWLVCKPCHRRLTVEPDFRRESFHHFATLRRALLKGL